MFFKCKNCGGNVVYSPEKHTMYCPYCEGEKSEERVDENQQIEDAFANPEEGRKAVSCNNCGGEIPLEQFTSATQCPYCGSYHIIESRVEGEYEPKKMIPFQLGKEACKTAIKNRLAKVTFAPADILAEVKLNSVQGMYVPYWLYDYDTKCTFSGEGTKIRKWTSGSYEYTETSIYSIARDMDISYKEVPADASIQMPDQIMDLIEPFDYKDFVPFSPEYMSGFDGEVYNMRSQDIGQRAVDKTRSSARGILESSYSGYTSVKTIHSNVQLLAEDANYSLLPVWKYEYSYRNQKYPFYVNGQTGKVVGLAPLSKKKGLVYSLSVFVFMALTIMMIAMLLFL